VKRALFLFAMLSASACKHAKTEVVVELVSDLDNIDSVKLCVSRNSDASTEYCTPWGTGAFELPASYGVYTDDGTEPTIQVTATAYVGANAPLERSSSTALIRERSLLLRLGLLKNCLNKTCPVGQTCIEGKCESPNVDPGRLPDYGSDQGTQATCAGSSIPAGPSAAPACPQGQLCLEGGCIDAPVSPLVATGLKKPTSFLVDTTGLWVRTLGTGPDYSDGTVSRIDGTSLAVADVVTGLKSNLVRNGNGWIASSSTDLYYAEADGHQLSRMSLAPGNATQPLGGMLANPMSGLAVWGDGAEIFYVDGARLGVYRVSDGMHHDLTDALFGLAPYVSGNTVYFIDPSGRLMQMPHDGTTPTAVSQHAFVDVKEILVAAPGAYVAASAEDSTGHGAVWELPLDGSRAPAVLSHPDKLPWGLAVDSSQVYFVDINEETICGVPIVGGQTVQLTDQVFDANGAMAVDADYYYWSDDGNVNRSRKR
jgi:hypothetical protein